jgi:hypothetical protein
VRLAARRGREIVDEHALELGHEVMQRIGERGRLGDARRAAQARAQLRELARAARGQGRARLRALEVADGAQRIAELLAPRIGLEPLRDPILARADRRGIEQRLAEPGREPAAPHRRARLVERREQRPVASAVLQVLEQLEMPPRGAVEQQELGRAIATQLAELLERRGLERRDRGDQRGRRARARAVSFAASPCGRNPTRRHRAWIEVRVRRTAQRDPGGQVLLGVARDQLTRRDAVQRGGEDLPSLALGRGEVPRREIEVRKSVYAAVG